MNNTHRIIFTFSLISVLVATYNLTLTSGLLHHFHRIWHLHPSTLSLINAAPLVGMAVGGLLLGMLSDRVGRATILRWNWLIIFLSSVAVLFVFSPLTLITARVLLGIGLGSDFAIIFPYIVELGNRSRMVIAVLGLGDFGQWLAYAVDALAQHLKLYRLPFVLGILWVIPLALGRRQLPESLVWQQYRVKNYARWMLSLRTSKTRTHVVKTGLPWALHQISGQGLALFLPSLLLGLMPSAAPWGPTVIKFLVLPAFLVTIQVVRIMGPVKWQVATFSLRALSFSGACVAIGAHWSHWIAIALLTGALFWGSAGPDKTTVLIPSLLFRPSIHTSGQGMAEFLGRLGSLLGVLLFGSLVITGHTLVALVGFALSDFLGAAISLSLFAIPLWSLPTGHKPLPASSLIHD
ncbi:MFS transporter [Sulfobacillus thermosulfidooxidans]|nr:MFS transporter [Sulfobacillus thermosulfidooxidans]